MRPVVLNAYKTYCHLYIINQFEFKVNDVFRTPLCIIIHGGGEESFSPPNLFLPNPKWTDTEKNGHFPAKSGLKADDFLRIFPSP